MLCLGAPQGCVGGFSVATFRLTAAPPAGPSSSFTALRRLNNVPANARLRYQPLQLPPDLGKDARIALVMVPKSSEAQLTVLEPRSVIASAEWPAPFDARIVMVVFAPQGLDEKRLTNLVTRDRNLVAALADYADQTSDLETGLAALSDLDDEAADDDSASPVRANTPAEQALLALIRALNPAVSAYNPLGAGRRVGAATMMGKGAEAFFENAGGIVPGGGILPEVKNFLMPDTEFRAVYAAPGEGDSMSLCAQLQARTRNKTAYIWAYRLTTANAPTASVYKSGDVPIGLRVTVPLRVGKPSEWRLLERVYDWSLISQGTGPSLSVQARAAEDERGLRIDLRKFPGGPGEYRLEGKWDWNVFRVNGSVHLHRLDDFKTAKLTPESQDRFIAGTGFTRLTLTGADFLFVDKAWMHRPESSRQIPVDLPVERTQPADRLRLDVDTDGLRPGPFVLALSRIDGAVTELPVQLLPPPPRITGVARVNLGEHDQTVMFSGTGLDRIEGIDIDGATVTFNPANEDGTRRQAAVRLTPQAKAGDRLSAALKVTGMAQPLRIPLLLQVAEARPKIRQAKISIPGDLSVAVREGEIPAGSWVSVQLSVEPASIEPAVTLDCAEPARTIESKRLRAGERQPSAQLSAAGHGDWFLSFDPGTVGQSGCTLQTVVETEALGASDPLSLGKIVRLPRIESLSLTEERAPEGFIGILRGFDLEAIQKTGWDATAGVSISGLPQPVAGEGPRQTLRIVMPWPSPTPKAPLYVWLREETEGRLTKVAP
jgi:hypothetical protein